MGTFSWQTWNSGPFSIERKPGSKPGTVILCFHGPFAELSRSEWHLIHDSRKAFGTFQRFLFQLAQLGPCVRRTITGACASAHRIVHELEPCGILGMGDAVW